MLKNNFLKLSLLLLSIFPLIASPSTLLESIQKKKTLDVIILNSPTVFYMNSSEQQGYEYELISAFSKSINVDLNLTVVHTVQEALELTRQKKGDITVASLASTTEREKEFSFGPYYNTITEQVVCHNSLYKQKRMPKNLYDLPGLNILVGRDTHYESTLNKVKKAIDNFDFNTTTVLSTEQILEKVWKKEVDCTIVDSNMFRINQRYYPELVSTMEVSKRKNLGWITRKGDESLNNKLFRWLNKFERAGKLEELNNFYYGFLKKFDYYDTKVFTKKLKKILPKYEKYFKKAGEKYNIPWMILAAQAYQESHWKPKAKSPAGAAGLMMLTKSTAKLLKVKNRLNPLSSIEAGAKYFNMMRKKFPKEVEGKNLWAFSLAAYNVGLGHIYDAMTLAKKLQKNPYSWKDLKTVLPLLSQKKYYKDLKYGYARGSEPVRYVDAIHEYYNIIVQSKINKEKVIASN